METASRLLTGPASEPVTLAEAKRHCNVVSTDEDALITSLIEAAREFLEEATSRAYINQIWVAQFAGWPCSGFILPRPPLVEVSSVKYWDVNGEEQTLAATYYEVDTISQPGRIWWDDDDNQVLPVLDSAAWPVAITYVAGYGAASGSSLSSSSSGSGGSSTNAAAEAVPARAKQAILLLVGHWYRVREAVGRVEGEVALAFDRLVKSLRAGVYP